MDICFLTATTCIVEGDAVLLHLHKKFGIWLPVGGHIREGEAPHEAALREAFEETGLKVHLFTEDNESDLADALSLPRPAFIIGKPGKKAYDFVFFATAIGRGLCPPEGESTEFRWCREEELDALPTKENVRMLCKKALEKLSDRTA